MEAAGHEGAAIIWSLRKVKDRWGNYYTITYDKIPTGPDTAGETQHTAMYPRRIIYTLNDTMPLDKIRVIDFTYDDATGALERQEYNVELGGKNLAKFVWKSADGEWKREYHLVDHLGSRQVVCDASGLAKTGGDVKYKTFGEYESGD